MTWGDSVRSSATCTSAPVAQLSAEVIDALDALIARAGNPVARSSVAVSVLEQVYATVVDLTDCADLLVPTAELTSLHRVLQEIRAHQDRMLVAGDG